MSELVNDSQKRTDCTYFSRNQLGKFMILGLLIYDLLEWEPYLFFYLISSQMIDGQASRQDFSWTLSDEFLQVLTDPGLARTFFIFVFWVYVPEVLDHDQVDVFFIWDICHVSKHHLPSISVFIP